MCEKAVYPYLTRIEVWWQHITAVYINYRLGKLPSNKNLKKLDLNEVGLDFDATTLYPSAIWNGNSIYPKMECRSAFAAHRKEYLCTSFQ